MPADLEPFTHGCDAVEVRDLSHPGTGAVSVVRAGTRSIVTRAFARSPLRLLTPRNHGSGAWIYTSTYGGGLVDGDAIRLSIDVGERATALLSSQASTKIYRSVTGTSFDLDAAVGDNGLLVVAPDPVVCFSGATYAQTQQFTLAGHGSLVLVDWFTSGRRAMGERWMFDAFGTRAMIRRAGRALVYDALSLRSADGDLRERMGRFEVVCTVVVVGAALRAHVARILAMFADAPVTRAAALLAGASPLEEDGCILRLAGVSVEAVAHTVREYLRFLPAVLGDDPWTRKW